jgi:hypothetical protein
MGGRAATTSRSRASVAGVGWRTVGPSDWEPSEVIFVTVVEAMAVDKQQ